MSEESEVEQCKEAMSSFTTTAAKDNKRVRENCLEIQSWPRRTTQNLEFIDFGNNEEETLDMVLFVVIKIQQVQLNFNIRKIMSPLLV